jgi:chorismate synthase
MTSEGYLSNNSGGISGGISTGQEIKISIALKPTSSINKEGQTIDSGGESKKIQVKGRHDPCVGVRATPIAEAMTSLVIMDHFLRNRAQNADVVTEIPDIS